MKSEWRLFGLLAGFLFTAAAVYAWWTKYAGLPGDPSSHHVEWIGTVALILSGLLCGMCALFFLVVTTRIDPRPEDRPDAEISDAAGEVGFFSPGSYWPFGVALATMIMALGLVYFQIWMLVIGVVAVLVATGGLLFEYYTGTRRVAE